MEKDYPRPQLTRDNWMNLNGLWNFQFDDADRGEAECWYSSKMANSKKISVPFTYETERSGLNEKDYHSVLWYEREFHLKTDKKRILLHFEGVDYEAKVWINGKFAGMHQGAYARFSLDITRFLSDGDGCNRITVRTEDSRSCTQPRGKQTWKEDSFECWYAPTSGIWKTVWLEEVEEYYMETIKITPDIDKSIAKFEIILNQKPDKDLLLHCKVCLDGKKITDCYIAAKTKYIKFDLSVASTEEPWKMVLWSPEHPRLYDVRFCLENGKNKDIAVSYFGMRKISIENGKILLNHKPFYQRLILDQGYWEESGLTAPNAEALIRDIELIKDAGYNGLRKHEKIEDERFLYWCDKKGLVVWCEMPSPYICNDDMMQNYSRQWTEIVRQNYNHPCIIVWTAFNESWGIENIFTDLQQQQFTEGIYHLTKAYDTMRPVIVNDGWEHTISDIITLHDYEESGDAFCKRYHDKQSIIENKIPFNRERYALAKGYAYRGQPIILSEFGGIALASDKGWGYGRQEASEQKFLARFQSIMKGIQETDYISGFCYTQLTDVYHESNGLYTMQRTPKIEIEKIRAVNLSKQ